MIKVRSIRVPNQTNADCKGKKIVHEIKQTIEKGYRNCLNKSRSVHHINPGSAIKI